MVSLCADLLPLGWVLPVRRPKKVIGNLGGKGLLALASLGNRGFGKQKTFMVDILLEGG